MIIGGLEKFSLVDFPGRISAVIFTQGCNFRCKYCHNPGLVHPDLFSVPLDEEYVFDFLESRKDKLDGVVISGGEPTVHRDLFDFIGRVRKLGFLVKLDTNGSNPGVLRRLVLQGFLDFVAMDVKASFENYDNVCGVNVSIADIKKSIRIIEGAGLPHQFRTTYDKELLDCADLEQIRSFLCSRDTFVIQECIPKSSALTDVARIGNSCLP